MDWTHGYGDTFYRSADHLNRYPAYLRKVAPPPPMTLNVQELLYPKMYSVRKTAPPPAGPQETHTGDARITDGQVTTDERRTLDRKHGHRRRRRRRRIVTEVPPYSEEMQQPRVDGDGDNAETVIESESLSTRIHPAPFPFGPSSSFSLQGHSPLTAGDDFPPRIPPSPPHSIPPPLSFSSPIPTPIPSPVPTPITSPVPTPFCSYYSHKYFTPTPGPTLCSSAGGANDEVFDQLQRTIELFQRTAERFERVKEGRRPTTASGAQKAQAKKLAEQAKDMVLATACGPREEPTECVAIDEPQCRVSPEYAELERLGLGKFDVNGRWVPNSGKNKIKKCFR